MATLGLRRSALISSFVSETVTIGASWRFTSNPINSRGVPADSPPANRS